MDKLPTQFVDVWKKATDQISHYLDFKKGILESELVEVVSDASKMIGFVRNTTALVVQKKFEMFLRGFKPEEVPTEEQIEKLIAYIDDESKAEFVADTFSKVMLARSSKACLIMGTILQSIVDNKQKLTHSDLICMQALTNFFDTDITNFQFISRYITLKGRGKFRYAILAGKLFNDEIKANELDENSVQLTIEKSLNHQLLAKAFEIDLSIDEDYPSSSSSADLEEYIRKTEPGEKLNQYILRCNMFL